MTMELKPLSECDGEVVSEAYEGTVVLSEMRGLLHSDVCALARVGDDVVVGVGAASMLPFVMSSMQAKQPYVLPCGLMSLLYIPSRHALVCGHNDGALTFITMKPDSTGFDPRDEASDAVFHVETTHTSFVYGLCVIRDQWLVSSAGRTFLHQLDNKLETVAALPWYVNASMACASLDDDNLLLLGSESNVVYVSTMGNDPSEWQSGHTVDLEGHVRVIVEAKPGLIAAGTFAGNVYVWRTSDPSNIVHKWTGMSCVIGLAPKRSLLGVGGNDCGFRIMSLDTYDVLYHHKGPGMVWALQWGLGTDLFVGYETGQVGKFNGFSQLPEWHSMVPRVLAILWCRKCGCPLWNAIPLDVLRQHIVPMLNMPPWPHPALD